MCVFPYAEDAISKTMSTVYKDYMFKQINKEKQKRKAFKSFFQKVKIAVILECYWQLNKIIQGQTNLDTKSSSIDMFS